MNEYVSVEEWFARDVDHIVLLGAPVEGHRWGNVAVCYTRTMLRNLLDNVFSLVLNACTKVAWIRTNVACELDDALLKVSFPSYLVHVPVADVAYVLRETGIRFFQVRPTRLQYQRTMSLACVRHLRQAAVSGSHGQEGTEVTVSRLLGVVMGAGGGGRRRSSF